MNLNYNVRYSLGPNGAIMTSLNLFTIRCFNQVSFLSDFCTLIAVDCLLFYAVV